MSPSSWTQKPNNLELWSHQELGCLNSKLHNRLIWYRLHHQLSQGNDRPSWTASSPFSVHRGRWVVQLFGEFLFLWLGYLLTFEQLRDIFLLPMQRSRVTYLQNRVIWKTALKRLNGSGRKTKQNKKTRKWNLLTWKCTLRRLRGALCC